MAMSALSTKAVGSTVKLNVNGVAKEFIVVHQGRPSTLYDASCDGTWLLMKDIYESRQWHSSNVNDYANSTIHSYLNSTFLGLFDADIKNAIKQVKLPYRAGSGYGTTVTSGTNGLSAKIFLLSSTEVAFSHSYMPASEGAVLSYFNGCAANAADSKRIAYLSGSATVWWLRSPFCHSTYGSASALYVLSDGGWYYYSCSDSHGIRPALVLPSSLWVADDGQVKVNVPPTITSPSGASGVNLGTKTAAFDLQYTVSDPDGDNVTVKEYLDDTLQRSFSVGGVSNTFQCVSGQNFQKILNGAHTLKIVAEDGQSTTSYEASFTKSVTAATITLKAPLAVAGAVTAAVLTVTGDIPTDAVYKVEVTNNALDPQPVWQDVTTEVKLGQNILFENTTFANGAAFNFRISASRGPSGKGGSISVVGGAFQ